MQLPIQLLEHYRDQDPLATVGAHEKVNEIKSKTAVELDGPQFMLKRRAMIASVAAEDFASAFERYMGNNDLVPINYLELGLLRSHAVGRLQYFDLIDNKPAVATGFLVSPDLLMTNCHVFSTVNSFRDARVEFNYQYDINGREAEKIVFDLDPNKFFHASAKLDFCLIGVKDTSSNGQYKISDRGYLVLNGEVGKAGIGDYAAIIQHPEGQPMQVAIRENKILDKQLEDALIYSTDTAKGSSGAAVFNDQWQLIALHSAGVAKQDAQGNYLDKDGAIIEPVNKRIDESRIVWLSNRGIRISAIMAYLYASEVAGHPLIMAFTAPSYTDLRALAHLSLPAESYSSNTKSVPHVKDVVSVPQQPPVYINISIGEKGVVVGNDKGLAVSTATSLAFEKKFEDEMDFSDCKGFDEYFMGDHVPLPSISSKVRKKLAMLIGNPNEFLLKYHHFSSVQHSVRRMPVFSAINIWGKKRYDELDYRADKWYRDKRIDFDAQLNDEYYAYSNLDKGHMVRREDAEWGQPMSFAERAANMTCSYANACPQVPYLNRNMMGYHGDWGKLEGEIFEKGVKKESGPEAKICVYNGPIFDEEDPVYKSVQVPLRYWKIVVWRKPDQGLHTTCFMLSQAELIGDVAFEKLRYDEVMKVNQCSIKDIEKLTGLTFDVIRDWDTYVP